MFSIFFSNLPYLLKGAVYSIILSTVTITFGLLLGVLLGVCSCYAPRPVRWVITLYAFVFRGLPVLVVIFLFYYAPARWGIDIDVYLAAGIALVCYSGAFVTEIVRGAILAIPVSQFDSAKSLGLKTL